MEFEVTCGHVGAVYIDKLTPRQPGNRPPVILIHGGAHTGACYLTTFDGRPGWGQRLASAGYPVVVPDWPGSGRSGGVPQEQLNGECVCRWLGAVLESLDRPAIVLTHSMSGAYGWRLIETHGDTIERLIAIAPAAPGNIQPEPEIVEETPDVVAVKTPSGTLRIASNSPFIPPAPFIEQKLIGRGTRFPRAHLEAYAASLQPIAPRLLYERLNVRGSQLRLQDSSGFRDKPVLVVTGSHDTDHPREVDEATVQWLRSAGARVDFLFLPDLGVEGNGHMLMLEDNAEAVCDRILAWIDGRAELASDRNSTI